MADKTFKLPAANSTIDFNIVSNSPHVVAYRVWKKEPNETDWTKIAEGHTADDVPDHQQFGPFPSGATVAYWMAVGGHPNTPYKVATIWGSGGILFQGGHFEETGVVSDAGSRVINRQVEFDV